MDSRFRGNDDIRDWRVTHIRHAQLATPSNFVVADDPVGDLAQSGVDLLLRRSRTDASRSVRVANAIFIPKSEAIGRLLVFHPRSNPKMPPHCCSSAANLATQAGTRGSPRVTPGFNLIQTRCAYMSGL